MMYIEPLSSPWNALALSRLTVYSPWTCSLVAVLRFWNMLYEPDHGLPPG